MHTDQLATLLAFDEHAGEDLARAARRLLGGGRGCVWGTGAGSFRFPGGKTAVAGDVAGGGWPRANLAVTLAIGGATSGGGVLVGCGFRGEKVGGGWLMIGGVDFEEEGGEGQKWQGGCYI